MSHLCLSCQLSNKGVTIVSESIFIHETIYRGITTPKQKGMTGGFGVTSILYIASFEKSLGWGASVLYLYKF